MSDAIDHVLAETRFFSPPEEFARQARLCSDEEYRELHRRSIEEPEEFWGGIADELVWYKRWTRVLNWDNPPFARWFEGGKTNITVNCLDRHLTTARKNKAAILWEGEPYQERRTLTYLELHRLVCRFANALKNLGVGKGDRVAIYLPMVPELAIAMLACARIGAIHSVIFAGFSAPSLVDRLNDAKAKAVITADGGFRRGQVIPLKSVVDEALLQSPTVRHVVVLRRTGTDVHWVHGRDHWWRDVMDPASSVCEPEPMDSEDPLFILYTSGSTGKPKGVLHTTGGYMVGTYLTTKYVFDLREEDTYWCTADIGWVTGHSYIVYGPLANGATTLLYEGAPNHPTPDRFWQIVERYRVNIFYTAPTAIRAFMKWGDGWPRRYDLSSLRLLGTVGEPINPEAWLWYHKTIGQERCPIVDTWWQTETGGIMITPLPGLTKTKPGSATIPFFGVDAAVVDEHGHELPPGKGGLLVIRRPWPSMVRTLWGDDDRFVEYYWSRFRQQGWYLTGDGAVRDEKGYFTILGRIDDVINVSGHRLSTMELESALASHPSVVEAAVVGFDHEIKGLGIAAFVTPAGGVLPGIQLAGELSEHVKKTIGAIARPDQVRFTDSLPKTRSGKIMRRLLRDIASGREIKSDTSTLEDYSALAKLYDEE